MSKKHDTKRRKGAAMATAFEIADHIYVNGERFTRDVYTLAPDDGGEIDIGGKTYILKSIYNEKIADLTQKLSDLEKSHAELTRRNAELIGVSERSQREARELRYMLLRSKNGEADLDLAQKIQADKVEVVRQLNKENDQLKKKNAALEVELDATHNELIRVTLENQNANAKTKHGAKINPEELSGEVARSWLKNGRAENERLQKKVDELEEKLFEFTIRPGDAIQHANGTTYFNGIAQAPGTHLHYTDSGFETVYPCDCEKCGGGQSGMKPKSDSVTVENEKHQLAAMIGEPAEKTCGTCKKFRANLTSFSVGACLASKDRQWVNRDDSCDKDEWEAKS